jgi:hypothetical protein
MHAPKHLNSGSDDKHMANDNHEKSAGIKDIAKALRISIGTVDLALHDRPGRCCWADALQN